MWPDGKIRKSIHRYNRLSYEFYPKFVRQIVNLLIIDYYSAIISIADKINLLGAEIPKNKTKINKDDPYGEEDWMDDDDDETYEKGLMKRLTIPGIDYID